jgi:hypothetical protein
MPDPHITLHTEPGTVEDELHDPLEEQLTSALQAAVDRLSGEVTGQPVDQVYDQLRHATSPRTTAPGPPTRPEPRLEALVWP